MKKMKKVRVRVLLEDGDVVGGWRYRHRSHNHGYRGCWWRRRSSKEKEDEVRLVLVPSPPTWWKKEAGEEER